MDTPDVDKFIRAMGWVPTDSLRGQVRRGMRAICRETDGKARDMHRALHPHESWDALPESERDYWRRQVPQ